MKLTDVMDTFNALELQKLSIREAEKLRRGDTVKYGGEIVVIVDKMKRNKDGRMSIKFRQINGVEDNAFISKDNKQKNKMSDRDKKTMMKNIITNCETFKDDQRRLLHIAATYYWNLADHNCYCEEDVSDLMSQFPNNIKQQINDALMFGRE